MTSCPVLVPAAVGVKTTATEHVVFGAKDLPQAFVWLKSPLTAMLAIMLADVPVALSATVCGGLAVPTSWFAKFNCNGEAVSSASGTHGTKPPHLPQ